MAETTILNIDFGDTFERLTQINAATKQLKEENEQLAKSIEEVGDATGDLNKQMLQNEAAIRANAKEKRTLNKLVDDTIKAEKAQKGSIEANRAELSKLTAEFIKLAAPTEQQIARIKTLSDRLKEQEAAIGDTRRNVGNYASALEGAGSILKKFGIDTSGLEQKLKSARSALVETRLRLQEVQGNLGGASGATDSFGKGLFTTTKNLFTTTKGLQLLKVALISTGIGAIVVALGSMIALFAKSEKGLDLITKGFTIMGAVVDTLVKRVESFVTGMQLIFSGEFSKGIDTVTGSFKGLASEISKTVSAASDLADAADALEDADNRSLVTRARLSAQVQEQRELAQDETKSIQERIAAQKEAIRIQAELSGIEENLAKQRNEVARQTFELSAKTANDEKEFAEAQVQAFTEEEARTRERIKLKKTLDSLNNEVAQNEKEQIKQTEEAKKKAAEEEQKRIEFNLKKQLETDKQYFEEQNLILKEGLATGELTRAEYNQKLGELKIQEFESQIEILETFGVEVADKENELANLIVDGKIAAREKDFEHQQEISEREKELKLELLQADEDLQAAKIDLAQGTFDIIEQFAKEDSTLAQAIFAGQKVAALAEVVINAQKGFAAIAANLAAVPPVIGVIPNPLYPVAVALAAKEKISLAIQTGISAATIGAQTVKGFLREGGELQRLDDGGKVVNIGGRSHAHGGTEISLDGVPVAEAEAGEKMFILKKTASDYINKFGMINQMFGGRSWNGQSVRHAALGGNIASSFDGGFVGREAIRDSNSQDLLNAIRNMPAPVVRVTEINKVQSDMNRSVAVSEL